MDVATSKSIMSIPTSTLRTSLLHAALFTATVATATAADTPVLYNTNALTTGEVTTPSNWVGSTLPGSTNLAAWVTDVDAITAGNQESRGGTMTVASPVSWGGIQHQDSFGPLTLTGAPITLGASGITEVNWEALTLQNNIVLGATQTWTNGSAVYATGNISGPFGLTKSGAGTMMLTGSSTFTGPISVGNGLLYTTSFNSVSGGASSSALGAPTTVADGTIPVSTGNTSQSTIGYLGAGETTDRVIHFPTGQGGIVANHGTGTLTFTSNMTGGTAAMGINFVGGGVGVMNGITNTTALINFNKQGLGKWTVNGNLQPNGGNIRLQGGILEFASTSSTTGNAIIAVANSGRTNSGVIRFATGSSIKTASTNTNGILGGWATYDNTTWAVTNGTGNAITGLTTYTNDTWAAGNNTDVTAGGANPASDATTNSLRFNQAGAKMLTLAGVNTLTSGGLIVTSNVGANATTITGGSLAGAASSDLVVHQHNAGGSLTISSVIANNTAATGLTKTGVGTLNLTAANTYTGTTRVFEGTLNVTGNASANAKIYEVGSQGRLEIGYAIPQVYGFGVTVNGAGTASTNGLYLDGGKSYTLSSTLRLAGAPTTVRTFGTGNATLGGYDSGSTHLITENTASGSVFDSSIDFAGLSYGYVMNIAPGLQTASGDVTLLGNFSGTTVFRKTGTGSVRLGGSGTSTNNGPFDVRQGTLIIANNSERLGTASNIILGNGTNTGRLVLEGVGQTLTALTTSGTGTDNRVVGGSATTGTLTINNTAASTLAAHLGGGSPNEDNVALVKRSAGVLTVSGTNSYIGGTTLVEGTLALNSPTALGPAGVISLGAGTLQFSANNTADYSSRIRLEDDITVTIDTNGQNVVFASTLQTAPTGNAAFTKTGAGTLTVGGNNNYSGPTTVSAGILKFDYSISNTSKIADNAQLKLAGGSLEIAGGNHVELMDSTELTASGTTTITRTSGSSVLSLGYLSRNGTGTLDLSAAGIARTSLTNDVSGKLPAWITIAGQPARVDPSGNILAYAGFADVFRLGGKIPNNPNSNVRIVNGGTGGNITPLFSGTSDISSLLQNADAGPAVVDLGGNTLRVAAEGTVIVPATSGALTIQNGMLSAGGASGIPGEILVDADGALTIDAAVEDNEGGMVTLSKTGSGSLTLTQSNGYTGGTILTAGKLNVNHNQALGLNAPLTIVGGTLDNTSGAPIVVEDAILQTWDGNVDFAGTNSLRFNATGTTATTTLTGNRTVNVAASELSFAGPITGGFGLTKTGTGVLTLDGANTYTGVTTVNAGTLKANASGNGKLYTIGTDGTFEFGYGVGNGYGHGVIVNGNGTAATTGLYLKGGLSYSLAETLTLQGAPTTVRTFGTGTAVLAGWDTNRVYMNVTAASSGSVFDSNIDFHSSTYGYRMNIAAGANTATGDVIVLGKLTGATNANGTRFQKEGAGSLVLAGQGTNAAPLQIHAGSVILSGGNDRIGTGAAVSIGNGTGSGKLVLNGYSQALAGLSTSGTGTTNAVVGGGATPSILTVNYDGATAQAFAGKLGGTGTNENNLALVKGGTGSWSLASGSYTGNTTVNGGELVVTSAFFADGADVALATGATLKLETAATDVIDQLIVNGVAQAPGVYGAVGSGAQFERAYLTGTGKLSVTTGAGGDYNSWELANNIAGAGANTDSDADGIDNGIEFVIGGDPSGPNSDSRALMPVVTTDANYINFVFRRTDAAAAYNPYVQYGSTLALNSWTKAQPGVSGVLISEDNEFYGAGVDRVTVKIPRTLAVGGKLFTQLRIDIP